MGRLKSPRIGPKMLKATYYVVRHPGCAKLPAAEFCAPYAESSQPGTGYGYASVNRAMHAGLIEGEWRGNRWALAPTDKGRALVKARFGVTS